MVNLDDNSSPTGGSNEASPSLGNAASKQFKGAEGAFEETSADFLAKAGDLAEDAKDAVVQKAENAKQGLSGGLKALGGAMRAAGDHLSQSGQAGSSKLISEAASGLERFADSLDSKPLGEVFEELRTFGHNNAGGLFAGSMLAGLALGRLLKATGNDGGSGSQVSSTPSSDASEGSAVEGSERPSATSTAPEVTAASGYAL